MLNIASAGDNIVCSSAIYGGTINLFAFTLKRLGIETRFFTPEATDEEISALIDGRTRLVFGETVANPALIVCDIERLAHIAHAHNVPLVIDNTFPTPGPLPPVRIRLRHRHPFHHQVYGRPRQRGGRLYRRQWQL